MGQRKLKKSTKVLGVTICAVLFTFLVYANNSAGTPKLPEPAVINEPLKTYYVGNMAMDIPESWKMTDGSATFFMIDEKGDSERDLIIIQQIKFTDKPWSGDQGAAEKLKTKLAELERIQREFNGSLSGQEDLSEIFGRPAAIDIRETKAYRSKFEPIYVNRPLPNQDGSEGPLAFWSMTDRLLSSHDCIEISLLVVEPRAIYTFEYGEDLNGTAEERAERVAAKRKMVIDWALAFLPRYRWTGGNTAPGDGFLATGHGHIAIKKDSPEDWYSLSTRFDCRQAAMKSLHQLEGHLNIAFSSVQQSINQNTRPNRTVGGRAGEEIKKLNTSSNPSYLFLNLQWTDLPSEPVTEANPRIIIQGGAFSHQKGKQGIAHVLGVWDTVLNSIRPASASN